VAIKQTNTDQPQLTNRAWQCLMSKLLVPNTYNTGHLDMFHNTPSNWTLLRSHLRWVNRQSRAYIFQHF